MNEVADNRKLVAFIYQLLRDHLPIGVVEETVREQERHGSATFVFTNGYTAKYAQEVADRLLVDQAPAATPADPEQDLEDLKAEIDKLDAHPSDFEGMVVGSSEEPEDERSGCPCLIVEPCSRNCTCATPVLSGGCRRCARYGSAEQRKAAAEFIALAIGRFREDKVNDTSMISFEKAKKLAGAPEDERTESIFIGLCHAHSAGLEHGYAQAKNEVRTEMALSDEALKRVLAENNRWRYLYLDQPEDRLYHAKDNTWWRRDDKHWTGIGGLVSADPPPGWVEKSKLDVQPALIRLSALYEAARSDERAADMKSHYEFLQKLLVGAIHDESV